MQATLNRFDPRVAERLSALIRRGRGTALFDADHTLYCDDAGEAFYAHLFGPERFAAYRALEAVDKIDAYVRLATDMAGMAEGEVVERARRFFETRFVHRIYPAMRELVAEMLGAGWDVRIVSASPRWIIQAGAPHLGLDPAHVIGLSVEVAGGYLTDRLSSEIPYGTGKVTALRREGLVPSFAAGDSAGDVFMLETAAEALVIAYDDYPGQSPLLDRALELNWMIQRTSK